MYFAVAVQFEYKNSRMGLYKVGSGYETQAHACTHIHSQRKKVELG